nr:pleiotropic drug resistance protein 2-like isoform X2 [Tanacetum cinerariifolium]
LALNLSTDPSELYLILNTNFDPIGDLFGGRDVRFQVLLDSKALSSLLIASTHLESFKAGRGGGVGMDVDGDALLVESALFGDDGVDGVDDCDVEELNFLVVVDFGYVILVGLCLGMVREKYLLMKWKLVVVMRVTKENISSKSDEVTRTLEKSYPVYDVESDDEKWFKKFNSKHFDVSGDIFEKAIDAFERGIYCSPNDYSDAASAIDRCLDIASKGVLEGVYSYWMTKPKKKHSSRVRLGVFQCSKPHKVGNVTRKTADRKKRSSSRLASKRSAEKQPVFKREAARRSEEADIAKQNEAQALMEIADLASYRATMALRIADALATGGPIDNPAGDIFSFFLKRVVSVSTRMHHQAGLKLHHFARMAISLGGDDVARSISSSSRRSWASASLRDAFTTAPAGNAFARSGAEDDEEELKWAAIERLPTYDRLRKGILKQVLDNGQTVHQLINITNLGPHDKKQLIESILKVVEEDNEKFLIRVRARIDRVRIDKPKIEVRYKNLSIEGDVHVGSRALPTLLNATINTVEGFLQSIRLVPSKKRVVKILHDLSGIVRPSRMTLLLGPPSSGKTTFLRALAGVLDSDLRVTGDVTYCGHNMSEFIPQRTCAYISQHDLHYGEMTVRETLDFAGRCLGVGTRYDLLAELSRREKEGGIKPDPEIDAFMKATAVAGQESSVVTDYALKILGLDMCADIMVGDAMRRGISGGQKKRVTTGEMQVGPAKVFFMDEISTGLDSSTTYQIVKFMKQIVHIIDVTMIISLLQPTPETFELFDDIILLSEGQIVYQGPREDILSFFQSAGFKCPERKGVADFLQEVTSKKDQEQYWFKKDEPYCYVSVPEFVHIFSQFQVGERLYADLAVPYDKTKVHPAALVTKKYGISNKELLKANLARELLLMKRNAFLYIFKTTQITIMSVITFTVFFRTEMRVGQIEDGGKYFGGLFFSLITVMFNGAAELGLTTMRLPVFFKQRDLLFYPAWAFALPIWIMKIPISIMESLIWICLTYYTIGFAPSASRFFKQLLAYIILHQMALSLFRFISALGRTQVVANAFGTFSLLLVFVLGGFIVAKDDIHPWMIWGYYISPMMYGQNAIAINEFLDDRWSTPNPDTRINESTVGKVLLKSRGMFTTEYMFWVCVVALFGFSLLFNLFFVLALTYLNPPGDSKTAVSTEDEQNQKHLQTNTEMEVRNSNKKGMVLPFQPLSLAFDHVNYYVDMPAEMKTQGTEEARLQLLQDISGAFRPGILTALVGVSGAGKTTLMDVLAGRKTGGYIDGSVSISGYPKNQETFARVSGYCEQNDIHSPHVTVYESLVYSAWLRLAPDITKQTCQMFVEEVMDLVELNSIRNARVGLPGINGLSTEQRKRLTIAVELVANPSIIFMDEPTSGLDARAAAVVMRTVRNTVDTGRTVVCTIHQPSIDIFEAFDELLLMKRGGKVTYAGPLGHQSYLLIEYFESISGVNKIKGGQNPATWMLDISSSAVEAQLSVDFAEIYANSDLYRRNQELIKELSAPAQGSHDLHFPTKYSQSFFIGLLFGMIFWDKGQKTDQQQDVLNLMGAMYASVMFLGGTSTSAVQTVVSVERTVFYREKAAGMYSAIPYAFAQQIPIWWRWYYWGSPVAWTVYCLITSQLGQNERLVVIPGQDSLTVKEFINDFLGFEHGFLGYVALAHVVWVVLFGLVFAYGIKFLNFQRR